jgi:hypothetical protein
MKRSQLERKPMKRSQPKRDWTDARAKVEREGSCRVWRGLLGCDGGGQRNLEAAHIIGRKADRFPALGHIGWTPREPWVIDEWPVDPLRIVPLCQKHHRAYDAHELDLLPYLTVEEQAQAVLDAGGIELARNRICGGRDV